MTRYEDEVVKAAIAWHEARYPALDVHTAFETSDRLHEAIERLPARTAYRCTVCGKYDDDHTFMACLGGTWERGPISK